MRYAFFYIESSSLPNLNRFIIVGIGDENKRTPLHSNDIEIEQAIL